MLKEVLWIKTFSFYIKENALVQKKLKNEFLNFCGTFVSETLQPQSNFIDYVIDYCMR